MEIKVKGLLGEAKTIAVQPLDTLRDIQPLIQVALDIPDEEQKIVYYGKVLDDRDKRMFEYHINKNDILVVFRSSVKPVKKRVAIKAVRNNVAEEEKKRRSGKLR